MTPEFLVDLATRTLRTALLLAAPPLVVGLLVGIAVSIFQSVTQIQEQTLVLIPKMVAVIVVLLFAMPWMLQVLVNFTTQLYIHLPEYVR